MIAKMQVVDNPVSALSTLALAEQLDGYVQRAAREAQPLVQVERTILDTVLAIGHAAVQQFITLQGDGNLGPTLTTPQGATLFRSDEPAERKLRTIFGEHTVTAYVYAPGVHEAIALRPIDARMALSDSRFSYLFEEFTQFFCVEQAFSRAAEGLELVLRQQVSVDSLERINQRMGPQAAEFQQQLPLPKAKDEGELLVVTGDGKGVPMIERTIRRTPAFAEPGRPGNRKMAILAGVYSIDPFPRTAQQILDALFAEKSAVPPTKRPEPCGKTIVARFSHALADGDEMIEISGPIEALTWASQQVAQRRRPDQPLLRLMDGQTSLWDAADLCLAEEIEGGNVVDILDILHGSSYVSRTAKVFHSHGEQQEAFARDRLERILHGEVQSVIAGLRQMATKRRLRGQAKKEIDTVCGYLANNAHRMRYDEYLRAGYPIATGVIEGACRHLVKDRMERAGMRWSLEAAQAMLNVRAVEQSSHWQTFHAWRFATEQAELHPHRDLLDAALPEQLHA